jgi:hypothetical protein
MGWGEGKSALKGIAINLQDSENKLDFSYQSHYFILVMSGNCSQFIFLCSKSLISKDYITGKKIV